MHRQVRHFIKPFLLLAVLFLFVVTACHSPVTQSSTTTASTTADCQIIEHRLGEACVPIEPKRIVALDTSSILDSLLTLEIKPIGTVVDSFGDGQQWSGKRYFPALVPELVEGIEVVGVEPTPSLEAVLKLKPDLIIMADQFEPSYEQLSKIAPTVLVDVWKNRVPIKENFIDIAEIFGKEEKARAALEQYEERISEFRKRLSDRVLNSEISVLDFYENQLYELPGWASCFQIFLDIGLKVKPGLIENDEYSQISVETIEDYDSDIMFFIGSVSSPEKILQNPLIQSLEAVKSGRAYFVDSKAWDFYGPIGMELFLDDLSNYLLKNQ